MRVGVLLLPTDPWPETVARVQRLEALGYSHVWVYDHLSWQRYQDRPWHATHPWLAGLTQRTESIRLGTMVSNPNLRHPLLLAKDAMTIDHLSDGRLTLGLGAGGTGFDASVLGQDPLDPARRVDRLEELARLLDGLLRGSVTDHRGDWYEINDARVLPGCVQQPRLPLAVAAGGARTLRLVAELADAWITYGDTSYGELSEAGTERVVLSQRDSLESHCEALGRDPGSLDRIYLIGNTEAKPLRSIEAFTDFAGRYEELGFTDIVFHHPRPDDPVWNESPEIVETIAAAMLRPPKRPDC
ncbi:MAG: LLM class flavin-dependent oxidoreductase [Acidimicrobiia bacterium]|nr:LLM class flavin-dependent oxidoreductase [Acidimicrobiia bacterium]